MKVIIVGLGVQGKKRMKVAGKDVVATVDPFVKQASHKSIYDVAINSYDAVLLCVPDEIKINLIIYFLKNNKHILVEKPLLSKNKQDLNKIKSLVKKNKKICYTAYNHRFEPHIINMKKMIKSKKLGKLYSCRMFYGNSTAKLVKSNWRDKGKGIINDLAPHLIDICHYFFGKNSCNFKLITSAKFENNSPDHALLISEKSKPKIHLETSYIMWKNDFTCDLIGSRGSAHINRLCKWGDSIFTYRKRKIPSGKPKDIKKSLFIKDPTWKLEYEYFKNLIKKEKKTDFSKDIWIQEQIKGI